MFGTIFDVIIAITTNFCRYDSYSHGHNGRYRKIEEGL